MIDYEKVEAAQKLMEESGADYVLGYNCGGYRKYSMSMAAGCCIDNLMSEIIMGAARTVYKNDGEPGALRSLDRMSAAITHARRETWARAGEERVKNND